MNSKISPCDCLFRPASTIIAGHYSLTEGIATVSTNTYTSVLWLCAEAHSLVYWGLQPVLAQMGAFGKRSQMSGNYQMEAPEHQIHFDVKMFHFDVRMDWVFRGIHFDTFGQIKARQPLAMSSTPEAPTQPVNL